MKIRILEVCVFCFALALKATAQTPIITSEPQSATNNIASAADFKVVATNAATYQWYFQGAQILIGQTNATLSLDDLSTNEAGSYTVVVTSSNNLSVTSAPPAVLTIVPGTILQWTISTYPGGGSSNFLVQLFDHDKPATVENFIHYITSGAYSNLFLDRDATNFVLQGGDYITADRSSTNLAIEKLVPGTHFPSQLENEFGVGPLIHNTFGTLAMALVSGETNSAGSAFFFNLVDNSATLDSQDFTVFGRILYGTNNGSNILQYFNALSAPSNGIYDYSSNSVSLPTLPVNDNDTNAPTDANLFYCGFVFVSPTNPPADTTSPTVLITSPAPDVFFTNFGTLTVQGTAGDNVGLAEVFCVLTSSTGAYGNLPQTNFALGTANWSLSLSALEPGAYQLTAYAEDGAGNLSAPVTEYFTNAANLPPGLAITNPAPGAILQNTHALVNISGTVPSSTTVTQITVQLFSQTNVATSAMNATTNGTSWSLNLSNLMNGVYTIVVLAVDSSGEEGLATETFTAQFPPTIVIPPANINILDGSVAEFSVTASNAVSYQWELDGTNIAGATNSAFFVADVSTNMSGSTYQVIITNTYGAITSAPVVLTVVTGTMVQITIAGFPDGSSSNVVVQLYDHEKPATVANFLHYITPARYGDIFEYGTYVPFTNMIWDRCIPGFILQGGDYDATDQTNETAPQNLESTFFSVYTYFTDNSIYIPHFASSVDNEFNVGPVLHNTFGTLAMAKAPGEPDSAAGGFFFNLADNSTNLDNQNGGYTVFGRLVSGSNVLQYFNTLSKPNGGLFDSTSVSTNTDLPDLPVNYKGWQEPADANLFFADFTLLSTFNTDTNPPTIAVNAPANGQRVTNAVVMVLGTAADNVAVANVSCTCRGSNYEVEVHAIGTTNWTANLGALPPGSYTNIAVAQDGAGNTSKATNNFSVPLFPLVVTTNGNGTLSPILTNTTLGQTNAITAKPGKGEVFANWVLGTNASIYPEVEFVLVNGTEATATFISNNVGGGISVTLPANNAQITSNSFSIKGKLASSLGAAQVNCRIYNYSTTYAVTSNMVVHATNGTWATPPVSLAPGTYVVQAYAQTAEGRGALVNHDFVILAPLNLIVNGRGGASIPNGTYLYAGSQYTQLAYPAAGESFLSWNNGSNASASLSYRFTMTPGLTLSVSFVSNSFPGKLTFTSPKANSQITNPTVTLGGRIVAPLAATQVVCQLFQNGAPLTGFMPAIVLPTNWMLSVSNLTMGNYNAVALATDQSGKTTLASEAFSVNFYPNLAGNYKGLFFDPANLTPTNAGFLSLMLRSVSAQTGDYGVVSGTLMSPLRNYSFSVNMTNSGAASVQPSGFDGTLALSFDVTNFSPQVTGSVTKDGLTSPLTAYRTLTKLSTNTVPSPGPYVLRLMPQTLTNEPPGSSFAAVTVSAAGNLAVAGTLADNSSFSQSTGVFTNGVWPLYASFYKGQGFLIGWETNQASGESAGTLFWIKSPRNGSYDTGGVEEQLNSVGTNYVRPAPGVSYRIVFGGGTVNPPVTNEFSFNAAGTMVTTNQLKGSVVASTGVLKGSFVNPVTHATIAFSGIFVSQTQGGGGFTLDADAQTGYFEFTPVPEP